MKSRVSKEGFTLAGFVKLTVVLTLVLTLVMLALPVAIEQPSASFTKEHLASEREQEDGVDFAQPPSGAEQR